MRGGWGQAAAAAAAAAPLHTEYVAYLGGAGDGEGGGKGDGGAGGGAGGDSWTTPDVLPGALRDDQPVAPYRNVQQLSLRWNTSG